jgi:hypothetical protein
MSQQYNPPRTLKTRITIAVAAAMYIVSLILGMQEILYFSSESIQIPGLSICYGMHIVPALSFLVHEVTR